MNEVYILFRCYYDDPDEFEGVFATRSAAEEYVAGKRWPPAYYSIERHEVTYGSTNTPELGS